MGLTGSLDIMGYDGTLWGCTGSLDMMGYKETKLPTSSQETVLFRNLLDLSRPWKVSRQNIRRTMEG